jgi:hypothetical protein
MMTMMVVVTLIRVEEIQVGQVIEPHSQMGVNDVAAVVVAGDLVWGFVRI